MGARSSKSANITATPKKGEGVVADENNHVANGDTGKTEHIIDLGGAKEQVKDLMKDIANEAMKKGEEVMQEVTKEVTKTIEETTAVVTPAENGENTAPSPTKEDGEPEKKKVKKTLSFRRFSFLRKEKKSKEDKQKTAEVTSPEKKEEQPKENGETTVVVEEGQGDAPKAQAEEVAAADASKVNGDVKEAAKVEEKKEEEKKDEIPVGVVVEKVDEPMVEEPAEPLKNFDDAILMMNGNHKVEISITEKVESLVEGISKLEVKEVMKEVSETINEKTEKTVESMKSIVKETMEAVSHSETITNGETNGTSNEITATDE